MTDVQVHAGSALATDQVRQAFAASLDLPPEADIEALELGRSLEWDSIGHMALVADLEERFGIALEVEDIVSMTSYASSIEILRRLGVPI